MKKQYTTPQMEVYKVNQSEIVCASVFFGDGTTDEMHANGRGDLIFDDSNVLDTSLF